MSHEHPHEGAPGQPSEEELRAALEEEMRRITVRDVLLQTVVSLVNLGGRRLGAAAGSEDVRDLEQVRMAIEGVRALLPVLEERDAEQVRPVRDALAQLQMAYAREAGQAGGEAPQGGEAERQPQQPQRGPARPRDAGRLWVPPGSTE